MILFIASYEVLPGILIPINRGQKKPAVVATKAGLHVLFSCIFNAPAS